MYPKTKVMRAERRVAAEKIQTTRAGRSDVEQIARLDKMFGAGLGAAKEREKIFARNEAGALIADRLARKAKASGASGSREG